MVWHGVHPLLIAFSELTAERNEDAVLLRIDGERYTLSPATARRLRTDLHDVLTNRQSFVHTACVRHSDGSYVIERRRATSTGNQITFDSMEAIRACFVALPNTFCATDVECDGITGSRRHLLVRHFAEAPLFACELVCENPLRATKKHRSP